MDESSGDVRRAIGDAVSGFLSPEQAKLLIEEILKIEKSSRGWCPECNKQVWVKIPDAKAVASALSDLANQAFGRPGEQQLSEQDRIVFERVVFVTEDVEGAAV